MQQEQVTYFLGIDWGSRKIGLALADSELKIASTLAEINASEIERKIDSLMKEYLLQAVVIGIIDPKDKFSPDNRNKINELKDIIEQKGIRVELEQELFSSRMAQRNLADSGQTGITVHDNSEAARIILQSWLDRQSK